MFHMYLALDIQLKVGSYACCTFPFEGNVLLSFLILFHLFSSSFLVF
jgi:hypothetical protein